MDIACVVAGLSAAPCETALILDVDGTLAPIAPRPELAAVPDETRAELARLVRRYRLVACISGRSGADAARLVGVDGVRVVGNHGLELDEAARALAPRIAAFRETLDSGWLLEDKGLTLSLHYRGAADEAAAIARLRRVAERAEAFGLEPRWGRKVLEIRPPVESDKGTAVRVLLSETAVRRGLYAGDDATDLDGFRGLAGAGLELAVRVAVASAEAPPELLAAADLVVDGPDGLRALLGALS